MRMGMVACVVLFAAPVVPGTIRAQDPGPRGALVTVQAQPEVVTVGEPFTVRVRVRAPRIATIRFPAVPDSGDAIEAIDPRAIEDAGDTAVIDRSAASFMRSPFMKAFRLRAWPRAASASANPTLSMQSAAPA